MKKFTNIKISQIMTKYKIHFEIYPMTCYNFDVDNVLLFFKRKIL